MEGIPTSERNSIDLNSELNSIGRNGFSGFLNNGSSLNAIFNPSYGKGAMNSERKLLELFAQRDRGIDKILNGDRHLLQYG